MRTIVLSLAVLAALGVAGCSGGHSSNEAIPGASATTAGTSHATADAAMTVSGTVGLRDPGAHQLSDQARLTIKLVDLSAHDAPPLDVDVIGPITALPAKFSFTLKPGEYNAANLYVVQAEIVDGIRHYTMPLQAPVLTKGAPAVATIRLVAIPTPGETLLAAYKKVKSEAGAMRISKGTSLDKTVSRGWQVFRDPTNGEVRYVVELSNFVKGGFTHTEFAYKDGKPWVVVQEKKSNQHAHPSEIDRAGWDDSGKLVLKDQVADGKTTTLDADTATQLHQEALAMFARAKKTR